GFFGDEMVHPKYRVVEKGAPVSRSLTPVYPTTAGLSQTALRGMIERALDTLALEDTLDPRLLAELKLQPFRESVIFLHRPPPDAPPAAGRRRQRQDPGGGAGRAAGGREWLAVGDHGAHGDPRGAALPQALPLARAPRREDRVAFRKPQGAREEARRRCDRGG